MPEGEGRHRRRRGPRGRGAGRCRPGDRAAPGRERRLERGEAVRAIEALSPAGLELVEEPTHGLEAVREVRERVAVRVAIDETAAEHGALGAGVADAVCLKISRCGGISGLIAAATLVRASGAEVYLASTLDGPLGVAAAVHAAAALASRGPVAPCGLATLALFEDLEDPLPAREGRSRCPLPRARGRSALSGRVAGAHSHRRSIAHAATAAGSPAAGRARRARGQFRDRQQLHHPLPQRPELGVA